MRRELAIALVLAAGCRDPKPVVPVPVPPAAPPVPRAAVRLPTTGPTADAVAAGTAYLDAHHLHWGQCLMATPTFDGGAILSFAHTDGSAADPRTMIVGADRTVTVVEEGTPGR